MSVLEQIVASKREELTRSMAETPLETIVRASSAADPPRGFARSLDSKSVSVIAEMKRASPSAGKINDEQSPSSIATACEAGGASALSVLTDRPYFKGSLDDLIEARRSVRLPVLRKDFMLDPYHVYEARAAGADAILLIAAILPQHEMDELLALARGIGMDVLVEVHTAEEMKMARTIGATLIGINNRNLHTFETRLETTEELAALAPDGALVASLSGIRSRDDVERVAQAGARAILVGESLMRQADVAGAVARLANVPASCRIAGRTGSE